MKHVLLCCTMLALVGCGGTPPQDVGPAAVPGAQYDGISQWKVSSALMEKPASVPNDYVFTPRGFEHPDCLHQLQAGETTRFDHDRAVTQIVRADGSVREEQGACAYPSYSKLGVENVPAVLAPAKGGGGARPNITQGYQFKADYYAGGQNVGDSWSAWHVPALPASGSTVYIWNGVQGVYDLFQPILYSHGANWGFMMTVNQNGQTYGGVSTTVQPGQVVEGESRIIGSNYREYGWVADSTSGPWTFIGYTDFGPMDTYHDDAIFGAAEIWATACSAWQGAVIYGMFQIYDTEVFYNANMCIGAGCSGAPPPSMGISVCVENSCNTSCSVVSTSEADWSWHN